MERLKTEHKAVGRKQSQTDTGQIRWSSVVRERWAEVSRGSRQWTGQITCHVMYVMACHVMAKKKGNNTVHKVYSQRLWWYGPFKRPTKVRLARNGHDPLKQQQIGKGCSKVSMMFQVSSHEPLTLTKFRHARS